MRALTCLVLLRALCLHTSALPTGSLKEEASLEPRRPTVFVKGRLELRLVPASSQTTTSELSCSVRPPGQKDFKTLVPGAADRLTLLDDGAAGAFACGVRVQPVGRDDDGDWTLKAIFKDGTAEFVASTTVSVQEYSAKVIPDRPSVSEGDALSLRVGGLASVALSACAVELPSKERVELAPRAQGDSQGRVQFEGDGSGDSMDVLLARGWCAVRVAPVGTADAGAWVLEATEKSSGVVQRGEARATVWALKMAVLPAKVVAQQGEQALLALVFHEARATVRPWTGCQAVRPDGAVVQLAGAGPLVKGLVQDDSVRFAGDAADMAQGLCRVMLGPLRAAHAGKWGLAAADGKAGPTRSAAAAVLVKAPYRPAAASVTVAMGTQGFPLNCGPAEALSCVLSDPSGEKTTFRGSCRHSVDRVRAKHRGNWTCWALLDGYEHPVLDSTLLQLAEPQHTETGVEASATGVVLVCRLAGSEACRVRPSYCRLEPPAGPPVLVREAVLPQGRFSYAGKGLGSCDCSMAIRAPLQAEDYGVWRCVVGFDASRPRGGLIELTRDGARLGRTARGAAPVQPQTLLEPSSGVVAPGSPLTVGCRAARALSYCWLRTPRGEHLAVDEESVGPRYAGLGLELGECAVKVNAAVAANHSGTWRCGMGFGGGQPTADVEVPVSVLVSDSLLVALHPNVTATAGSEAVTMLGCRTPLDEGLRYCRFQRPDGSSIHLADSLHGTDSDHSTKLGRFSYSSTAGGLAEGFCTIAIYPVAEEDYGVWTCAASLAGDVVGREQTTSILLLRPEQDVAEAALIGVGACLLLLAVVTVAIIGGRYVRRRQSRRRSGSTASWLSDNDDALVLETIEHSPSPTTSADTRRPRATRVLASAMTTTRLPARTRRSGRKVPRSVNSAPPSGGSEDSEESPPSSRKRQ